MATWLAASARRCLLWSVLFVGSALAQPAPLTPSAPAPMLASTWPQPAPALDDFLFSEKLDGVRARWDGRQLTTRGGNRIAVPPGFTAGWPAQVMDGELWLGRGQFDRSARWCVAMTRRIRAGSRSRCGCSTCPPTRGRFEQRYQHLQRLVANSRSRHLRLVQQQPLADPAALQAWLDAVVQGGGEGLIAHHRYARHVPGRSALLFKIKPWRDAEALVIAHTAGRGKYSGMLGALQVRDDQGRVFAIGSGLSDAQRRAPPAIGSRITYRYTERTVHGLPRFPRLLRIRADEPAPPRP
jgi:ATP-dependent DNA ligase